MRRILLGILFLLPAFVLAGWLFAEQFPILLSPQWWWISASSPNGAPAACEAATSLRLYQGQRLLFQQPTISAEAAKISADRLIAEHYTLDDSTPPVPLEYGGPSLFSAVFEGQRRLVWVYTARVMTSHVSALPGSEMPGPAAVVYLDANTGDMLALLSAVGAGNASVICPFPLRDWAVATIRFTPFVALAGYVGLLLLLGIVWIVLRLLRKTRAKRQNTV
jgi:hypothetical protein